MKFLINLFKILNLLLKCKFIYTNPKTKKILVFDDESYPEIKDMMKKYDHKVLSVRKENVKHIYISLKVIILTICNYRGNLYSSYLISLIVIINPKIVFTFIDNSFKFSELSKRFRKINKNIKFVALQNGARYEPLEYEYLFNSGINKKNFNYSFYFPTLLSFGLYEKDLLKKKKISFNKISEILIKLLKKREFIKYREIKPNSYKTITKLSKYVRLKILSMSV